MTRELNRPETREWSRELTDEEMRIVTGGTSDTGQFRWRYQLRLDAARELFGSN